MPPTTAFRNQRCSARIMPSTETPLDGSLVWWDENIRAFWGFVSSCEWVVASLPWRRRGPHRRGVVGLTARRRRRSVHRLAKTTPRRRFGALVYTVGLWAWVMGGLGIAIVYTNGRIGPLCAVLGRLCTLLRLARIVRTRPWWRRSVHRLAKTAPRRRFGAFMYTVDSRGSRELRRRLRPVCDRTCGFSGRMPVT